MVDVIISFDSEDILTPEAADGELWWAEALRERGIRGSFQLVAEMIRFLRRLGREDVIDAFRHHEIGFHSNFHSVPPSHPQAVEGLSLSDGIAHVIRNEAVGLAELATTYSTWPVSYCSPGDSWTPATLLAMASMGVRVFCNDNFELPTHAPYWYCGMLMAKYSFDFMSHYEDDNFQAGAFETRFNDLVASTPDDGVIILYTHPTRLMTSAFWDVPFFGAKTPKLSDCPAAPLRPQDEIKRCQERSGKFLDWLVAQKGIRFIDFATLYEERSAKRRDLEELLAEHRLRPGKAGELPQRPSPAGSFLPSSVFANMQYNWPIHPVGFTGKSLIDQAAAMAWTAAPSHFTPKSKH